MATKSQTTPPASPLGDATNKKSDATTPTKQLVGTCSPPYATPMAKLTHPSPEPTINSLRMLNVVLQKRLAREEESRKQLQAMVKRNEAQQQQLMDVIKVKQDQLRMSLEQQCDLTSTVRELQDSQRHNMVVQADQDREIQRLKARLVEFQQQDTTLRQRLSELEQGSMSTQAHVQQVASTIAAIKQQGRTAQEADDAVQELQQRVHEARKRQRTGGCGDVDAHGRPLQQSSVAGGGVLDRRGVKALLSELQSATRMQHKAHAKIKQLEGVADRLRAEITAREDALMHARAELQEARAQTQRLQEAAQEAEMGHADQVEMLRKQQAALVQRCKEADTQLQEIMLQVQEAQALHAMSTSADAVKAAALQAQLHDAAAAREAAEARAVALQEELAATEVRLQQAAARGTPRGEGAKVVLQKSFARIRQLQGQLAEAHAAMGEAAALREGLAEAQERVRDLEAHMHAELSTVQEAPADVGQAAALQVQLMECMRREQEATTLAAAYKQQLQQLSESREELQLRLLELEEVLEESTGAKEEVAALHAQLEALKAQPPLAPPPSTPTSSTTPVPTTPGTPQQGASRVLTMALEKVQTLQAQLDKLQAAHRALLQRQAIDADRLQDADGLLDTLLSALGVQDGEARSSRAFGRTVEQPAVEQDTEDGSNATTIIAMLPARLRAALHGLEVMRGSLALSARGTEEHRQLRDELQATVREKANIAAENAALKTEMRSLEKTAALLREEVDSSAEKLAALEGVEARVQRARAAEEQIVALRQQVETLQRRLASPSASPIPNQRPMRQVPLPFPIVLLVTTAVLSVHVMQCTWTVLRGTLRLGAFANK